MFKEPTPEAAMLKAELETHGLRVLSEVNDGYKSIDLGIPSAKMNIEVDGMQHLTDPYQILSDLSRSHFSDQLGYETLRIHNEEIRNHLPKIAKAIAEAAKMREEKLKKKD